MGFLQGTRPDHQSLDQALHLKPRPQRAPSPSASSTFRPILALLQKPHYLSIGSLIEGYVKSTHSPEELRGVQANQLINFLSQAGNGVGRADGDGEDELSWLLPFQRADRSQGSSASGYTVVN